jgi:hypothetical protein
VTQDVRFRRRQATIFQSFSFYRSVATVSYKVLLVDVEYGLARVVLREQLFRGDEIVGKKRRMRDRCY